MALLLCALMLALAGLFLMLSVTRQRRGERQALLRLQGELERDNKVSHFLRSLGDSRFGQRSVSMDSETQILLNRVGWRRASQRSAFAACQIGVPIALAIFVMLGQTLFYPDMTNPLVPPLFALGIGYLLPKRVLASLAGRRQKKVVTEIGTFIPLLRILFESGMAVEQALRVLSNEGRRLLPVLSTELRVMLVRVDSGLELGEELNKVAVLLSVEEFSDTCMILDQLMHQGGGAMKSLLALKQLIDDRRLTRLQEYISKLSGKMSVVMMVFLFPALLIVLGGPGAVAISKAFGTH